MSKQAERLNTSPRSRGQCVVELGFNRNGWTPNLMLFPPHHIASSRGSDEPWGWGVWRVACPGVWGRGGDDYCTHREVTAEHSFCHLVAPGCRAGSVFLEQRVYPEPH